MPSPHAVLEYLDHHPRFTNALALCAGVLQVTAYAPFEWRVSAVASIALLFSIWQTGNAQAALRRGFLYGLGLFGAGVYWIYNTLHLFGEAIAPLAAVLTAGLVVILALFPALAGYLLRRLFSSVGPTLALTVIAPALWSLLEWLRHWLLTGFPWLHLGHSQLDWPLAGYLPLGGVFFVSWLTAATAGLLVATLLTRRARTRVLLVVVGAGIWLGGAALRTVTWSSPVGDPLRVRIVQGNVAQDVKFTSKARNPTIDTYTRLSLGKGRVDLVVWPETAMPTVFHKVAKYVVPVAEALQSQGTELVIGVLESRNRSRPYYNAVRRVDVGEVRANGLYFKHHLVPFGEYMPLRASLAFLVRLIEIPMYDMVAGPRDQSPMLLAGVPTAVSICYEGAFGEEIIRQVPDARLLLNVSNDAWFGDSLAPHQHLEIARVRAVETARAMIRATNTGVSAYIDADGRILGSAPQFETLAYDGEVQPRRGTTPYVLFGNWPVVSALVVMLVAVAAWRRLSEQGHE